MIETTLAVLVIILALFFTWTNGFQDGSSVTACAITSRAMRPLSAVVLVAVCEMAGAIFGGTAVSRTIQGITTCPACPALLPILLSGLIAAIIWNFFTRQVGFPSSSTHALVGGVLGAMYAYSGTRYFDWGAVDLWHPSGIFKVVLTLFVSPMAGFLAGFLVFTVGLVVLARASMHVSKPIRQLQWLATAVLAFAHGANDPAKSMGLIMLALYSIGYHPSEAVPLYIRVASGLAIALGVASLAPSIIKRVGMGIYKMRPLGGLAAEAGSAAVVLFGSLTGGPVSASQVISSSVMGCGTVLHWKNVRWLVAKDMLVAWFMTIPCAALLAWAIHYLLLGHLQNLV